MRATIASIRLAILVDESPDLSELKPDVDRYAGCTPEEIATYLAQDAERLASYGVDWESIGIRASATIRFSEDQSVWAITNKIESAGLWGIESDSGSDEFDSIGDAELSDLEDMLAALGFSSEDIATAFADVKKDW